MCTQITHKKISKMTTYNTFRIFLVDDDPFFLAVMKQHLSNMGFDDVHKFEDGVDCLNELHEKPDVIFLDHNMDTFTGYEVLKKIKRFDPNIFVVMVSAQEEIKTAVDSLKHGAFDYISKMDVNQESIGKVLLKIDDVMELQERQRPSLLKSIFSLV